MLNNKERRMKLQLTLNNKTKQYKTLIPFTYTLLDHKPMTKMSTYE